jgi:hypothetical protein
MERLSGRDEHADLSVKGQDLFMEIDTFDLRHLTQELADWVDEVRNAIFLPLLAQLEFPTNGEGATTGGTAWGQPNTLLVRLVGDPAGGASTAEYEYSEKNWSLLLRRLGTGALENFALEGHVLDERGAPRQLAPSLQLQVELNTEYPGAASQLFIAASREFYGSRLQLEVQNRWVRIAQEAATSFHAAYGYISLDYASPTETPYERSKGRFYNVAGLRECRERLRGSYWGNLLSSQHISRLGGFARVQHDAPCVLVEDLSAGRDELAYLQLTEDIEDIRETSIRDLEEYFGPLLPEEHVEPSVRRTRGKGEKTPTLPIEYTETAEWESLALTLFLQAPLTKFQQEKLARLLLGLRWPAPFYVRAWLYR